MSEDDTGRGRRGQIDDSPYSVSIKFIILRRNRKC